ncbi:MAG TPA: hypothetical protein VMW25_06655 [Clostridia bacterium]|nr:hypothetical protein [Clostridia bacterium]
MKMNKCISVDIEAVQYHKERNHNISQICSDALVKSMQENMSVLDLEQKQEKVISQSQNIAKQLKDAKVQEEEAEVYHAGLRAQAQKAEAHAIQTNYFEKLHRCHQKIVSGNPQAKEYWTQLVLKASSELKLEPLEVLEKTGLSGKIDLQGFVSAQPNTNL